MIPLEIFLIYDPSVLAKAVSETGWSKLLALLKFLAVSELFSCLGDCKESTQCLNIYQVFIKVSSDDFEFHGSQITPPRWSTGVWNGL